MKVSELIGILKEADPDKDVMLFWDGAARGDVEAIYESEESLVIAGEWGETDKSCANKQGMTLFMYENEG